MDCKHVRELLSAYIDDMLDPKEKQELERHIASCQACSAELAFMKKCIKEVGSLDKINAPDDFLQQVRQRIHRNKEFEKITRGFFAPSKIKVPLEFVGVLVSVILVVVLLKAIEPRSRLPIPAQREVALEQKGAQYLHEEQELSKEKVLSLESRAKSTTLNKAVSAPAAEAVGYMTKESRRAADYTAKESGQYEPYYLTQEAAPATLQGGARSSAFLEKKAEAPVLVISLEKVKIPKDEALAKIRQIIEEREGIIIAQEADKEDNLPRRIVFKIPAKNYPSLLESLKEFSELGEPLPAVSGEETQTVYLNIQP